LLKENASGILELDPWLEPFKDALKRRYNNAVDWVQKINQHEGGFDKFSRVRFLSPDILSFFILAHTNSFFRDTSHLA
jgi:hypothetical protein